MRAELAGMAASGQKSGETRRYPGKPSCVTMSRAEFFYQFGNMAKPALLAVLVKCLVQPVGKFFCFNLEQDAIEQGKMFSIHALDFFVQHWFQFFRLYWRRL